MVGEYFTKLMRWMNGAGVVWIFALTFLICADIVARELFDNPITGVPEMVALSLVASVFLQLAYAIHESRLTRAEILFHRIERQSPAVAQAWAALLAGVGIVLFALTAVGMWPDFVRALVTSEFAGVEGLFKITVWPIKFLIFFGATVAALECLRQRVVGSRRASQLASSGDPGWRSLVLVVPLLIAVLFAALWMNAVEPRVIGVLMIVIVLALIALGMSIAMALFLVGFLGIALLRHDFTVATRTLALAAEGTVSDYVFATVATPSPP